MPYVLKCDDIMSSLVLLMVSDTALGLADSGLVGAGQAHAELDHASLVDMA